MAIQSASDRDGKTIGFCHLLNIIYVIFCIARKIGTKGKNHGTERTLFHYLWTFVIVVFLGKNNTRFTITLNSFRHRMMLLKQWSWLCWSLTPVVVLELIKGTSLIQNNVALNGCVACVLPAVRETGGGTKVISDPISREGIYGNRNHPPETTKAHQILVTFFCVV